MEQKKILSQELENLCQQKGADLVGIADLSPARDFMLAQGGDWLGRFSRKGICS